MFHSHQLVTTTTTNHGVQAVTRLQAAVLGLQDTSWVTLAFIVVAVVATLFVQDKGRSAAEAARPMVTSKSRETEQFFRRAPID